MKPIFTRRAILSLAAALATLPAIGASAEETTNLRVQTVNPGSSPFVFTTTFQRVAQRELPVRFNVTSGMAATRSTLDAARGQVDIYVSSPAINYFMSKGAAMFKGMDNAPELAKNLRGMINFPLGPYHIITYADSGITKLEDIKGKRVYLGPAGGAATTVALAVVQSVTGYKPGEDYEQVNLDWTSGNQAFQDRQVDLAIIPTELPSASIQQFALMAPIRLIGIPKEAFDVSPLKETLKLPGRTLVTIEPHIYGDNQVGEEPVQAVGSEVGLSLGKDISEELGYQLTKVIFDNISDFYDTADWMKVITLETALSNMNVPLHPGALRFYREAGVNVPDELVPPEAR